MRLRQVRPTLDLGPSLQEVVRGEHELRRAREEVAYHDEQVRLAASQREEAKARRRSFAARQRLVRALGRQLLVPGEETEDFLARLDAFLAEAKLNRRALDLLAQHLDPDQGGTP